jgi:hypothetical protein
MSDNPMAAALARLRREHPDLPTDGGPVWEPVVDDAEDAEAATPLERAEQAATVDRAAILREAAAAVAALDYYELREGFEYDHVRDAWNGGTSDATDALRRMADEEQPAEVDEMAASLARDGFGDDEITTILNTPPRRRLTPNEYSAAWHAVEGGAGEDGADPATILNAVLTRLGIDGPGPAAEAPQPEAQAYPPETFWQIETQWHNGEWRSWALRTEHDDAVREFATVKDGTHAWRLVRFDTTTTVEAEHSAPQLDKEA